MKRHAKVSSAGSSMRQGSRPGAVVRGVFARRGVSLSGEGSGAFSARLIGLLAFLLTTALVLATAATAVAPVVTTPSATNVEYTTAHLEGEVNSEDKETSYRFEYITDAQYLANEGNAEPPFSGASQAGAGSLPEGSGLTPVSADLGGLSPQTVYHLRLVAENESGTESAVAASTFETKGPVLKPTIENLIISEVTTDSAHFSAEINPNGADPAFDTNWHFECEPDCGSGAIHSGPALSGASAQTVETDAEALDPNTTYTVRLFANNSAGLVKATDAVKTAGTGPLVKSFEAGPVGSSDALINAQVNPRGSDTVYWFEWGKEDCSAPEADCQSIPAEHDASAGSGPHFKYASRRLTGLDPETTYHFRLIAENEYGVTEGADQEFTTAAPPPSCHNQGALGAAVLPDCRAWEMVSPPDKNGGDVIAMSDKTDAAVNGSALAFISHTGSDDSGGVGFDAMYISRRTGEAGGTGWSTHAITPDIQTPSLIATIFGSFSSYVDFTPDLSSSIYMSTTSLTEAPYVGHNTNLYRRDGVLEGPGTNELLTESTQAFPSYEEMFPGEAGEQFELFVKLIFYRPYYQTASADLSHVVFSTGAPLVPEVSPLETGQKFYEHDSTGVHLIGNVPVGSATSCDDSGEPAVQCELAPSAEIAMPTSGSRSWYGKKAISADGSRIFFQANGNLYLREDATRTYQINVSEKTVPDSPQGASMWDATPDGSHVLFTTNESLVDEDKNGEDLYMWDSTKPEGERLTLVSMGEKPGLDTEIAGVVGISDNAEYIYFAGVFGQLVEGEPSTDRALYVWHDGKIDYIGDVTNAGIDINTTHADWSYYCCLKRSRISADGRTLLFATSDSSHLKGRGGFDGYEHSQIQEFVYNADSGRLACVSCNPSGAPSNDETLTSVAVSIGALPRMPAHENRILSSDGRYAFFSSRDGLVPEDTNGRWDAYEYDVLTEELHLLTSGTSPFDSYFLEASPDGSNAFVITREQLSGWDFDGNYDIYDARVNGGLPEPVPVPAPCEGEESCRGPAGTAPTPLGAASADLRAAGNSKQKRRHRKRHRKAHRRKQRNATRQHRAVNTDRRTSR